MMSVTKRSRRAVRSANTFACIFTIFFFVLLSLCLVDRFGTSALREATAPVLEYLSLRNDNQSIFELIVMTLGGGLVWGFGHLVWAANKP